MHWLGNAKNPNRIWNKLHCEDVFVSIHQLLFKPDLYSIFQGKNSAMNILTLTSIIHCIGSLCNMITIFPICIPGQIFHPSRWSRSTRVLVCKGKNRWVWPRRMCFWNVFNAVPLHDCSPSILQCHRDFYTVSIFMSYIDAR